MQEKRHVCHEQDLHVAEDSSQNIGDPSFSPVFVGCSKKGRQRRTIFVKRRSIVTVITVPGRSNDYKLKKPVWSIVIYHLRIMLSEAFNGPQGEQNP